MGKQKISIHEVARLARLEKHGIPRRLRSRRFSEPEGSRCRQQAIEQLGYKKNVIAAASVPRKTI